jgi:hypothetical protein
MKVQSLLSLIIYFGFVSWATYMRKDMERQGGVLASIFYLIGQVFTKRRVPSQEYAECASLLRFTAKSVAATSTILANFCKIITLKGRNQENRQIL